MNKLSYKLQDELVYKYHQLVERMLSTYAENQTHLVKRHHMQHLKHDPKIYANELRNSDEETINTITKQIPNSYIKVILENTLIDESVVSKAWIKKHLEAKIQSLKAFHGSKNKQKKVNKKIKRIQQTLHNIPTNHLFGDEAINWFKYPTGKKIQPITAKDAFNILEQLDECTGSVLLPSERLAIKCGGMP